MKTDSVNSMGWPRAALILAVAILTGLSAPASASGPWRDDRPITVGHRGTTVIEDENTMAAFKAAYDHGMDVFECDPRLTSDGVYVLMHDSAVDRTTDGSGKVSDMTLAEIKLLRTANGHQVPTLLEALTFAREHGMGVYLDLKEVPADNAELLVATIRKAGMIERVIAGCYELKTVDMIEREEPLISTCVSWPFPAATFAQAKRHGADAIGTLRELASPWAISRAHRKGLYVITMPINDSDEIQKFLMRGVDAVQTDDPGLTPDLGQER